MLYKTHKSSEGFTLIEVLVSVAVFVVIALSAYQGYISLFKLIHLNQYRLLAVSLANEQIEIARNMPYVDVGITSGIPNGKIPHLQNITRGGVEFVVESTVRNLDLPSDGTIGGSPNDSSSADNKLIEVTVSCNVCGDMQPVVLTGQVAPKGLETASTNGALFVRVFDSAGQPVSDADVHVENNSVSPAIVIDDVTGADGMLQIIDAPPGVNVYEITVSKSGYSTEKTYLPGAPENPDPLKSHATVALQQVTQISFAIDRVSTLHFSSDNFVCAPIAAVDFRVTSTKEIGAGVPKYSENVVTDATGELTLNSMEWGLYDIEMTDPAYDLAGLSPLNPLVVNPNTSNDIKMAVVPAEPNSVLLTVKDSVTGLPLSGATVHIEGVGVDESKITGRASIGQEDWSQGSGQEVFVNPSRFFSDDGQIEANTPSGEIKLREILGEYVLDGSLESSTFDLGGPSDFHDLIRLPSGQPPAAGSESVRLQVATSDAALPETIWDFVGPDGTASTFYASSSEPLNQSHNGDQFMRYKVLLSTASPLVTPNVSEISFTFSGECVPTGQVIFSGLSAGDYTVTVSKSGYSNFSNIVSVENVWQEEEVVLAP